MHLAARRIFHPSRRFLASTSSISDLHPWRWPQSASLSPGTSFGKMAHCRPPICAGMARACLTSVADGASDSASEVVREMYDKMFGSLKARTMPANAWLWSLVSNCSTKEDVTLLFKMLEKLRIFVKDCQISVSRRILMIISAKVLLRHVFDPQPSIMVGSSFYASDELHIAFMHQMNSISNAYLNLLSKFHQNILPIGIGKKTLWKHNTYGLTSTIASAHHLLLHAKKQKDARLMVDIMKLLKKNDLPLQPGTADIVFSICSDLGEWGLLSKYAKKFIRAGVKLRRTSFGTWMEFAARRGDLESLWKIEELRLETVKQHNLATGFSCVKGYLLEGKPNDAASLIHVLYQNMSEQLKPTVVVELQKLTSDWPLDVIKQQNKEDRKAMTASLRSEIKKMNGTLSNLDRLLSVSTEDILRDETIPL